MKKIGGDASYAGNANREMCTSNGIQTCFVQKGKRAKEKREKDFVRQELRGFALRRWKDLSERRRSITPCVGSRPERRKQRSCTSSSAFTRRM